MDTQVIEKGFERVWQMFQETDKKFLDTDLKFRESAEQLKKIENMFIGKCPIIIGREGLWRS